MALADELERLRALHDGGELTDEEYARAKDAAIRGPAPASVSDSDHRDDDGVLGGMFGGDGNSLGGAANRYVNFQIVMAAIGLIVFLVFACSVLPNFNRPPGFGP
jgi:hypothetical protein